MAGKLTLYHEASKGGFKQWSIWIEPDHRTVTVEWGLVGKSLQTSSDTAVPKGKAGTKAYKDEETCARENYDRQVRKKREEGYRETMDAPTEADWLVALDKNFVPAKPISSIDDAAAALGLADGTLRAQRKRDGRRHLVLKTRAGAIKIYSRRMEDLTAHLLPLTEAFEDHCRHIPNGTIIDGEVLIDRDGADDFRAVGEFTNPKSSQKTALDNICALRKGGGKLRFYAFDILYHDGQPVWEEPYATRWALLQSLLRPSVVKNEHIMVAENLRSTSLAALRQMVKENKWEGLVLWYQNKPTHVRRGGKPKRTGCAKWKPVIERDFIATGWYYGSGEFSKVVGGFYLADIDPETGQQRSCGNVGTGLDDEMRAAALTWEYPCVLSIKFDKQEPTAKLRFPVVLKKHEDKTPDECIGLELEDDGE